MTMEAEYKRVAELFPNPDRMEKVGKYGLEVLIKYVIAWTFVKDALPVLSNEQH